MKSPGQTTGVSSFLKAVPYLRPLSLGLLNALAQRFAMSADALALLVNIAATGGALYEN
jgi:hypothetical protein